MAVAPGVLGKAIGCQRTGRCASSASQPTMMSLLQVVLIGVCIINVVASGHTVNSHRSLSVRREMLMLLHICNYRCTAARILAALLYIPCDGVSAS